MHTLKMRLRKAVAAILLGAVTLSIPIMTDAKRIHDPQTETKSESRHHSEKDKTVNLTLNHTSRDSTSESISSFRDRIDDILNSMEQEPVEQPITSGVIVVPTVSASDPSIIGTPMASQRQCVKYLLQNNPNPNIAVSAEEIVSYYYEEGTREGIRPDVAFAQALKETGFFRYGGTVTPDQNNYCGLGTTSATVKGFYFPSPQIGVRAHIQHLLAYSSTRKPTLPLVDPRYFIVRKACGNKTLGNWQDLNGRWAVPGNYYGQEILSMFKAMLNQ